MLLTGSYDRKYFGFISMILDHKKSNVLRYPWRGSRLGWLVNAIAVSLGFLFGVYGLGKYIFSPSPAGAAADSSAIPVYLSLIGFFGLCTFFLTSVIIGFARAFELTEEGMTEHFLWQRKRISWNNLKAANRIIKADSGPNTERFNRVGIELIGDDAVLIFYQDLQGYDYLRQCVSAECKKRDIPMKEKNASWEATKYLKNNRLQDLLKKEGWKTTYIEREIDEL